MKLAAPQVVYYVFAMVGMELFKGKLKFYEEGSTDPGKEYCGNPLLKGTAFAQLSYCKNNFNNVVSSFILLVELTVVNQWHDILLLERLTHRGTTFYQIETLSADHCSKNCDLNEWIL